MKIAYISAFYPFRGGIAQFNGALYRALETEHEVKAFTFSRQYPKILFPGTTQEVSQNDSADPIPAKRILDSVNPITWTRTVRAIKDFEPDIVLSKFWMPFLAPSVGWVLSRTKKFATNVCVLGNVIPHESRFGDEALVRYNLKQSHGFLAMGKSNEQELLGLFPDAKYFFHEHPFYEHFPPRVPKDEALRKLNLPKNKKMMLFFGFIRDYKGLDILLESFSELGDDYHLIIAGEIFGSFDKHDEIIKRNGAENKVSKFIKYIDDGDVSEYFSAADVCVLPYRTATQSGITGISMNYNLPVIVTNVGSLPESIGENGLGIVCGPPDSKLLASAVKDYFENNRSAEFIGKIKSFKSKYSWESLAKEIVRFANKLKT